MAPSAPGADRRPRKERTENAARRRGQLAEAALRSIVRNGLPGTTLATVAREAGLSQGVAVFYFQSKERLLAAALERHYAEYQANWTEALAEAGIAPADRLAAMVRADFAPRVCGREAQIVWHAFWGEASARPLFNQIAERFDRARSDTLETQTLAVLEALGRDTGEARMLAAGIEGLIDGLWLQMYLSEEAMEPKEALAICFRFLAAVFPEYAPAFRP
jgi:TetR/AcrR family transcriptional regulator, transcriptional repressor of bet genes